MNGIVELFPLGGPLKPLNICAFGETGAHLPRHNWTPVSPNGIVEHGETPELRPRSLEFLNKRKILTQVR